MQGQPTGQDCKPLTRKRGGGAVAQCATHGHAVLQAPMVMRLAKAVPVDSFTHHSTPLFNTHANPGTGTSSKYPQCTGTEKQ